MAKLIGIPAEAVDGIWDVVRPLVVRCLAKTDEYRWTPEDILGYLRNRDQQLWACATDNGFCGIVITEIAVFPQAKECILFMMAGKLPRGWRDCLAQLEQWARDMGCTHMATLSRPGSARIVGYEKGLIRTYRGL